MRRFSRRIFSSPYVHHSENMTMFQLRHHRPYYAYGMQIAVGVGLLAAGHQFVTKLHQVPISGRTQVVVLSKEEEFEIGQEAYDQNIQSSIVIENGPQWERVVSITKRLALIAEHLFHVGFDWKVTLVQSDEVNACCFPGGKIVVCTGLLDFIDSAVQTGEFKNKYDALAAVLAHEVGHALGRHSAENMSLLPIEVLLTVLDSTSPLLKPLWSLLFELPYSRKHEEEADYLGLILMSSACYDAHEAIRFWEVLEKQSPNSKFMSFFSTHPCNADRSARLREHFEEATSTKIQAEWCAGIQQHALTALRRSSLLKRYSTKDIEHQCEMNSISEKVSSLAKGR